MAVKLTKGATVNLKKDAPNLKKVLIGLGWDPIKKSRGFFGSHSSADMDIDASVICINSEGSAENIVYYGRLAHPSGAIKHCGDNLTGEGDGDDEQIIIYLEKVPSNIVKLSIIINIYQAYSRNQHFGDVKNCFVHADDMENDKELIRYDIDGNFDHKTGIFVADIYRYNGEWKFKAIGEGVKVGSIGDMVDIKCQ